MTFREAARKLFGEVRGLLAYEAFSREALDRFYAMREKLHRPLDHFLRQDERFRRVRREVCDLVDAAGEYVIRLRAEPERRAERRAGVEDRLARLEETFRLGADAVAAPPAGATGWRVSRRTTATTAASVCSTPPARFSTATAASTGSRSTTGTSHSSTTPPSRARLASPDQAPSSRQRSSASWTSMA